MMVVVVDQLGTARWGTQGAGVATGASGWPGLGPRRWRLASMASRVKKGALGLMEKTLETLR